MIGWIGRLSTVAVVSTFMAVLALVAGGIWTANVLVLLPIGKNEARLDGMEHWRSELRADFDKVSELVRNSDRLAPAIEEMASRLATLERRVEGVTASLSGSNEPLLDDKAVAAIAAALVRDHRDALRGEPGPAGTATQGGSIAELDDGTIVAIAAALARDHREQLRGEPGPPGPVQVSDQGGDAPGAGPVRLALRLQETGEAKDARGFSIGFPVCTRDKATVTCTYIAKNERPDRARLTVFIGGGSAITDTMETLALRSIRIANGPQDHTAELDFGPSDALPIHLEIRGVPEYVRVFQSVTATANHETISFSNVGIGGS